MRCRSDRNDALSVRSWVGPGLPPRRHRPPGDEPTRSPGGHRRHGCRRGPDWLGGAGQHRRGAEEPAVGPLPRSTGRAGAAGAAGQPSGVGAVGVRRGRIARRPPEQLTAAGDEPMTDPDQVRLLFGPYRPPLLKRGDRAFCLVRDGDVVITSWSYSRIPWPRCRAAGTRGGGTGLVIDEELARPVLHESAPADCYWWG